MQKAMGGTGNYGDQAVYGTPNYAGGEPSTYANLMPADQPISPGAFATYGNASVGNTGAMSPAGGFGSLTAGLSRDTGMMQPGQVSAGQYGSYAGPGQSNPYTEQQAGALTAASNANLKNVFSAMDANNLGNGSYGSNRQAIAQGVAAGQSQSQLDSTLANLRSSGYQFDVNAGQNQQQINNSRDLGFGNLDLGFLNSGRNYDISRGQLDQSGRQIDNNFALGMGGLNNAATAQNQSFYSTNRGQDLSQAALAAQLYGQGVSGQAAMGQGVYGTGQAAQQAPWQALSNWGNLISPFSGLGGSQVTTGSSSPAAGALGGALVGSRIGNAFGGTSSDPLGDFINNGFRTGTR